LYGCPIRDFPAELLGDDEYHNCLLDVRAHFSDLGASGVLNQKKKISSIADTDQSDIAAPLTEEPIPVYISYCWGDRTVEGLTRDALVNRLYDSLERDGFDVHRDNIIAFEEEIGKAPHIIAIISESYLRSEHCMYELFEVWRNLDFEERIYPFVLPDTGLRDFATFAAIVHYWEEETEKARAALQDLSRDNLSASGLQSRYNRIRRITQNADEILSKLSIMNTLTVEQLEAHDFAMIRKAIVLRE